MAIHRCPLSPAHMQLPPFPAAPPPPAHLKLSSTVIDLAGPLGRTGDGSTPRHMPHSSGPGASGSRGVMV